MVTPTEPGFYWHRNCGHRLGIGPEGCEGWHVVRIDRENRELVINHAGSDIEDDLKDDIGEWGARVVFQEP
jgi:hypothetical protein